MDDKPEVPIEEPLTDSQVQALNAVEKYSLIQALVTKLVEDHMAAAGSIVDAEELLLLADYRRWKKTPQAASGVFHWKRR